MWNPWGQEPRKQQGSGCDAGIHGSRLGEHARHNTADIGRLWRSFCCGLVVIPKLDRTVQQEREGDACPRLEARRQVARTVGARCVAELVITATLGERRGGGFRGNCHGTVRF